MRFAPLLLIALLVWPAFAQEGTPPLPLPRPLAIGTEVPSAPADAPPVEAASTEATPAETAPLVPLPRPRPEQPAATPEPAPVKTPAVPAEAEGVVPKPPEEPRIYQSACPAVLLGAVEAKSLPPIAEAQCGERSPLSVTGVLANGRMIPFTGAATLDCPMATALPAWVADVDSYLRAKDNTGIESVIVGTSYMCRNVNNGEGGNLSFHAFAAALDVVGFKLEDGRTVTVEQAWSGTEEQGSRIIRFAHDAACTHFTTTLGPEANALHHDHLHLDLGCHGKTCTARLCE